MVGTIARTSFHATRQGLVDCAPMPARLYAACTCVAISATGPEGSESMGDGEPAHFFITAPDGLKLHACGYGKRSAGELPVVCLPGLARTTDDFHALAVALAGDPDRPRYVLAVDYR